MNMTALYCIALGVACIAALSSAAAAAAAVGAALGKDDGSPNNVTPHRVVNKGSKKRTHVTNEEPCTLRDVVGKSMYINCSGEETELEIICGEEEEEEKEKAEDHHLAHGEGRTSFWCTYTEHAVVPDEAVAGCVIYGSFDPTTSIHRGDPARPDVCHLDFFTLQDSCDAGALPTGFGMKAEIPRTTGPHHNDDDDNDNSGMKLRFSTNGGLGYYNENDLRETVPIPASRIPQRQLQTIDGIHPIDTTGYNAKCYCGGLSAHPECYNAYYCCLYCKCDSCPSDPFSCRNHAESCGCPTFNGFTSDAELFENDNNLKV